MPQQQSGTVRALADALQHHQRVAEVASVEDRQLKLDVTEVPGTVCQSLAATVIEIGRHNDIIQLQKLKSVITLKTELSGGG